MKSFSNRVFVVLLLTLMIQLGNGYLYAQSVDSKEASQPESKSGLFEAVSCCEGLFGLMDADQDSFVTRDEWQRIFADYDEDGDNRLSKEEIESFSVQGRSNGELDPNQGRLAAFGRLDVNRNNVIDHSEWPGHDGVFGYLDANQNGSLTREEFLSNNARFWNQPFENLDFDADGIIVRSEWLDSDRSFDRLDRDRNGAVERREFYNPR